VRRLRVAPANRGYVASAGRKVCYQRTKSAQTPTVIVEYGLQSRGQHAPAAFRLSLQYHGGLMVKFAEE